MLTVLSIVVLLSVTLLYSCKKDNSENTSTPSYNIHASEKLVIPAAIAVPENLPGGNTRAATYYAEGVQKYKSQVKPNSMPVMYEWIFIAPEAILYDVNNHKVGTHGAGPYWQAGADSIFGQQYIPAKTTSPDTTSIPWLLLMPKAGKTPSGIFKDVIYIQRIATKGGKAPKELPTAEGQTANVNYTAVYRFTKKN